MMAGRGALPYEGNPGQSGGNPGQPEFASPRSGTRTFRCLSRSARLARKLPRYPQLRVTLLGRLAVDQTSKGLGLRPNGDGGS